MKQFLNTGFASPIPVFFQKTSLLLPMVSAGLSPLSPKKPVEEEEKFFEGNRLTSISISFGPKPPNHEQDWPPRLVKRKIPVNPAKSHWNRLTTIRGPHYCTWILRIGVPLNNPFRVQHTTPYLGSFQYRSKYLLRIRFMSILLARTFSENIWTHRETPI